MNHPNTCECCAQHPCCCEIEYVSYHLHVLHAMRREQCRLQHEQVERDLDQPRLDALAERAEQRGLHRSAL